MKKSSLVLFQGKGFSRQGPANVFVKDILRVGRWVHPITKEVVDVTLDRIQNLVRNVEEYRQTLDHKAIPYQDGHNFDAKKTLGWWKQFFSHGDRLYGVVDVTDGEAARKMEDGSIRSVSARIDYGAGDTKGKVYDEVFTHVCATPLAVLDGQHDFIKLSREADCFDLLIPVNLSGEEPKEKRMDPKKMAALLGLPEDADEAKILVAAKAAVDGLKTSGDKLKGFEGLSAVKPEDLKAHGLEIKDGKVVKLSGAPPEDEPAHVKALREEIEGMKKAQALSRHEVLTKAIESSVLSRQLPPAGKAITDRMLARVNQAQTLMLSSQSAEGVKSVAKIMEDTGKDLVELLNALPKYGETKLSSEPSDSEKAAEELSQKKSDEIVERTQGKPAAKK